MHVKLVWYYNNALGRPEKKKFIARAKALPPLYQNFNLPPPFVISAFGRLGTMFGYMPIGAVMVSPQVIDVVYSQSNKLGFDSQWR
ncbi:hypothetical protein V6Z12_D04G150700 [Gossypium hirsutum]